MANEICFWRSRVNPFSIFLHLFGKVLHRSHGLGPVEMVPHIKHDRDKYGRTGNYNKEIDNY
jgi:hypothetical protein